MSQPVKFIIRHTIEYFLRRRIQGWPAFCYLPALDSPTFFDIHPTAWSTFSASNKNFKPDKRMQFKIESKVLSLLPSGCPFLLLVNESTLFQFCNSRCCRLCHKELRPGKSFSTCSQSFIGYKTTLIPFIALPAARPNGSLIGPVVAAMLYHILVAVRQIIFLVSATIIAPRSWIPFPSHK